MALDVVFSRFRGFSFTITLRQKPKGVTRNVEQALSVNLQDREMACSTPTARNSFGFLSKGYCEQKNH